MARQPTLNGKAWKFGDDINTDIIIPFRFKSRTNDPVEMAKYAMYGIDPEFPNRISKGDIVVAGRNFGGGSSREQAPVALKYAGVGAIVAEEFARIFIRNCFTIGLPIVEAKGITRMVEQGDELEVDMHSLCVKNKTNGKEVCGRRWPRILTKLLAEGGLVEYYKKHKRFPW